MNCRLSLDKFRFDQEKIEFARTLYVIMMSNRTCGEPLQCGGSPCNLRASAPREPFGTRSFLEKLAWNRRKPYRSPSREGLSERLAHHGGKLSPRPCRLHLHPAMCGGREGLTMLNRTLSANLNGLNLGTRTLANPACLNIVATLGLRHAHPRKRKDSMRDMDAKSIRDTSTSIRGLLEIPSPMSSPFSLEFRLGPASPSPTSSQVVVVRPIGIEVSQPVLCAERASRAGRSPAPFPPRYQTRGRQQSTMTRALSNPRSMRGVSAEPFPH